MSTVLTGRRHGPRRAREGGCPPRLESEPEFGPTLDDVVSRQWEVLRAGVPVACMVCGSEVTPRQSAGAGVVGGRCDTCATTLS